MVAESQRLRNVVRVSDPFVDRRGLVRLDRNEDPDGWDPGHFSEWLSTLDPHDLAAYSEATELARKIASWQSISPDQIVVTAGSDAGIKLIFETYLDPGDSVLVLDPSWRMYDVWASVYQAQLVRVPFSAELSIEVDQIVAEIRRSNPRLVVIANPNQPTGGVLEVSDLERIADASDSVGSMTIIDEAYHLFSEVSAKRLLPRHESMLVVRTFSKAIGLAGLRIGYCLAAPERISELRLLRPIADASSLAIHAASFSLDHITWVNERISSIIRGREFLLEQLCLADIKSFPSETNFVLVACGSEDKAKMAVDQCRSRGYAIKGPLNVGPLTGMIRISIGSLGTMRSFWDQCGPLIQQLTCRSSQ